MRGYAGSRGEEVSTGYKGIFFDVLQGNGDKEKECNEMLLFIYLSLYFILSSNASTSFMSSIANSFLFTLPQPHCHGKADNPSCICTSSKRNQTPIFSIAAVKNLSGDGNSCQSSGKDVSMGIC